MYWFLLPLPHRFIQTFLFFIRMCFLNLHFFLHCITDQCPCKPTISSVRTSSFTLSLSCLSAQLSYFFAPMPMRAWMFQNNTQARAGDIICSAGGVLDFKSLLTVYFVTSVMWFLNYATHCNKWVLNLEKCLLVMHDPSKQQFEL